MKFTITRKLLLLIALPIITLLVFSLNNINDKYTDLSQNKLELQQLKFIQITSNLIHQIQLERGSITIYLNQTANHHFLEKKNTQILATDKALGEFQSYLNTLTTNVLPLTTTKYLNDFQTAVDSLSGIRENINHNNTSKSKYFKYYSLLNNQLISIFNSIKLTTTSKETNEDITILKRVLQYQEYAGQERALVARLAHTNNISLTNIRLFHSLISSQNDEDTQIHSLLDGSVLGERLNKIHAKYENSFFTIARDELIHSELKLYLTHEIYKTIGYGGMIHDLIRYKKTNNSQFYKDFLVKKIKFDGFIDRYTSLTRDYSKEKQITIALKKSFEIYVKNKNAPIDEMKILALYKKLENSKIYLHSEEWFKISSQRINDLHDIEKRIFQNIYKSIESEIDDTNSSLVFLSTTSIVLIVFLLISAYIIASSIKNSIIKLEEGIDDFFNFLNFNSKRPNDIQTNTNDEINSMAQNINKQMIAIENNLEEDKDFIQEITQIVTLMKDGNFSERPYFEPNNPNLIELKDVFNELIELIAVKIKEQTDSLERLNSSLEDRVYQQTLELEEQIKNITEARDKAIQAELAKDEFLANMSHEIRTPLNAILGFVTILQRRTTEEKSLNYLSIIDNSGKSLLTIINDILDFSKIQSGKFTITPYKVETVDEFSDACALFASKADEKHLVYAVYIDPSLPHFINTDAVRVKQILSNILSNSIKFTPEDGEIKVKVTIENSELIISVQDSGIGIEKENLSKIFSAFEQADGSTTRKYGGTGLGLSISAKLAALMNGDLSVHSELGVGSIFTLKLPIEIIENSPKLIIEKEKIASYTFAILNNCNDCKTQAKLIKKYLLDFGAKNIIELEEFSEDSYDILFFIPDDSYNEEIVNSDKAAIAMLRSSSIKLANLPHIQSLYAPFTPKSIALAINDTNLKDLNLMKSQKIVEEETQYKGSILIAEDNKTNQMLISLLMDDYGIEYEIANNGLEVVEMFKAKKYDMVLMDENMPELNGIAAMKLIKAYEEEKSLPLTPIIALTASVLQDDIDWFLSEGMDGFVGKPINTKELEAELDKYLKRI